MMNKGLIAKATIIIDVPVDKVWEALTSPELIKRYMFGTEVVSDWKQGSAIIWKGIWEGKSYQDKGIILGITPMRFLQFTHFSPLSGQPDIPENYHTLTYELTAKDGSSLVVLSQDNNANEKEKEHAQKMWESLLVSLKKMLENNAARPKE